MIYQSEAVVNEIKYIASFLKRVNLGSIRTNYGHPIQGKIKQRKRLRKM